LFAFGNLNESSRIWHCLQEKENEDQMAGKASAQELIEGLEYVYSWFDFD